MPDNTDYSTFTLDQFLEIMNAPPPHTGTALNKEDLNNESSLAKSFVETRIYNFLQYIQSTNPSKYSVFKNLMIYAKTSFFNEIDLLTKKREEQNENDKKEKEQWLTNIKSQCGASEINEQIRIFDSRLRLEGLLNSQVTTEYNYEFSKEYKNVESIDLLSVSIPTSWYIIDNTSLPPLDGITGKHNGYIKNNNFFYIDSSLCQIPCGTFDISNLIYEINKSVKRVCGEQAIKFKYTGYNRKVDISKSTKTDESFNLLFFSPYHNMNTATEFISYDSTLGYLLGFRKQIDNVSKDASFVVNIDKSIVEAEQCYNLNGTKNFYIYLEDYQNTMSTNGSPPTSPSRTPSNNEYIKYKTDCSDIVIDNVMYNGINLGSVNATVVMPPPGQSRNSIKLIQSANEWSYLNSWKTQTKTIITKYNPNRQDFTKLFAVIPLQNIQNLFQSNEMFVYNNDLVDYYSRKYYGTTSLMKFKIQLLDDYGRLVNLNGLDWSFKVKIKQRMSCGNN
mgnify:CR=1 FL=1|tara:strand:- start:48 stop:1559 length:1512 start_codon:yes stop_codon:yes gene_type:complete